MKVEHYLIFGETPQAVSIKYLLRGETLVFVAPHVLQTGGGEKRCSLQISQLIKTTRQLYMLINHDVC